MAMNPNELRAKLSCEEPVYDELAATLDDSDVRALRAIAEAEDVGLATKAIYLASRLQAKGAHDIVVKAAKSPVELKRIAAASGMANVPTRKAAQIAGLLLDEPNIALTKLVLRNVRTPSRALATRIRAIEARAGAPEELKALARERLRKN